MYIINGHDWSIPHISKFFSDIKNRIKNISSVKDDFAEEAEEEYVELDTDTIIESKRTKILVRPFVMEDFSDVKHIIDSLREGYTICLINIRPIKGKDIVELKRAVNKLKKTADALHGDIAGFGEDWIVATPGFAEIHRGKSHSAPKVEQTERVEENYEEEKHKTVLEQYDTEDVFWFQKIIFFGF